MSKFPKRIDELSNEPFYAILHPVSTHVPGDERSKTNPGHGYPEHIVQTWNIEVFDNKESWHDAIIRLEKANHKYKAIQAIPAKVSTETIVSIK